MPGGCGGRTLGPPTLRTSSPLEASMTSRMVSASRRSRPRSPGDLTRKPTLLLRYTRLLFTEYLRRQMHDLLGYGLAMESLALFEKPDAPADGS